MRKIIVCFGIICILFLGTWLIKDAIVAYTTMEEGKYPVVTIEFETGEQIQIMLYPDDAPNTVKNFIELTEQGFYDYTLINRIIPSYFVQGGDPIGNGYGYAGYYIESECKYNGFNNSLSMTRGTVAMARGESFNTEGSQFFILTKDAKHLNGQYSAFGKVISGMEVIDKMGTIELDTKYQPKDPLYIKEVTVDTKGYPYEQPEVFAAY